MMIFGPVSTSRIAYRKRGKENLYLQDAELNWAAAHSYSAGVEKRAAKAAAIVPFGQAAAQVSATCPSPAEPAPEAPVEPVEPLAEQVERPTAEAWDNPLASPDAWVNPLAEESRATPPPSTPPPAWQVDSPAAWGEAAVTVPARTG